MLGFEPRISCIASCTLYNYATRVHFMVISLVNTRYVHSKIYTGVARYLLAGVGRPALIWVQQLPLAHDVTGQDMIDLNLPDAHVGSARDWPWKLKLVAKHSLPVESRLGLTVAPSSGCAALSDSESAMLGSGAALQQFTGILDHDLFGCSCELELIVEPPARKGGRQVGLERKPQSARASRAEAKLGQNLKHKFEIWENYGLGSLPLTIPGKKTFLSKWQLSQQGRSRVGRNDCFGYMNNKNFV
jgi:hypothetical protein